MNKREKIALDESIAHWERLLQGAKDRDLNAIYKEGVGADNCALCHIYLSRVAKADIDDFIGWDSEEDCVGCPVFEKTGDRYCRFTPYYEVMDMLDDMDDTEDWLGLEEAFQKELDFLKGLREDR